MVAIWLRMRTELRAHRGATLALVVVVGVVGALVLAAAAGARRTSTAPERLVEAVGGEGDAQIFDAGAADPGRIRGHRRDLAVLKVLGFTRSQVAATAAWQGTAFAVVALAVGLPLGLALGRWLWRAIADQLGIVAAPRLPILAVLAMVPAALVVANVAAAVPGWLAARVRPADVLRSE